MTVESVVLVDYPVELGIRMAEHVEEWMREFKLIAIGSTSGVGRDVPDRLMAMVEHLTRTYAQELSEPERVRAWAHAQGLARVDLTYPVRPETAAMVRAWQLMLRDVDEYCSAQEMLTLQRAPEIVKLSDWVCEEFLRQVHGLAPQPWVGPVA